MKKIRINKKDRLNITLLVLFIILAIWSGIKPYDSLMWMANVFVAIVYALGFILTYKKLRFTTLSYILIFIHLVIILVAAKYTYGQFPPFNVIKDFLGSSRNNFDRLGHFFQGFVPIILARELFLRNGFMKKGKFFILVIIFFILAISASWELFEFIGAMIFDKPEVYVLSLQGDIWDAQWDMICAIVGAITSLIIFSKYHDKQIEKAEKG